MEVMTSSARSWVKAISFGLAMGPAACSLRSAARPSQNCARFILELSTVGELIGPCCQLCPIEVGRLSLPPILRLWHELQEIKPERDSLGSKKSFFPSSTLSGSVIINVWMGLIGSFARRSAITGDIFSMLNSPTNSILCIPHLYPPIIDSLIVGGAIICCRVNGHRIDLDQ